MERTASAFVDLEQQRDTARELGSKRTLDALIKRAGSTVDQRLKVASMQSCPPEVLAALATDGHDRVRAAVAKNPTTSDDTLLMLASDTERVVRRQVAKNGRVGAWTERTMNDADQQVRVWCAKNPGLPIGWQRHLASDPDARVRAAVASVSTDVSLLTGLADDSSMSVRREVAQNRNTPWDVAARFVDDRSVKVRLQVAYRADCPDVTLQHIADTDRDLGLRNSAQRLMRYRRVQVRSDRP